MAMLPLVFLPGFLCDERVWLHQSKALSDLAPVKVIDLRHRKNLEDMVQAVKDIPWEKFHLIGFSMGGYIAQVFATENSERLASLTVVASSGGALSDNEIKARLKMESILAHANYKGISPKEMHRYVHPDSLEKPEITNLILDMSAQNNSAMYLNQMRATLHRKDLRSDLQTLPFPLAILGGAEDRVATKAELENLKAGIDRATLEFLSPCGHYVPLEQPEALTTALKKILEGVHHGL